MSFSKTVILCSKNNELNSLQLTHASIPWMIQVYTAINVTYFLGIIPTIL